MLGIAIFMRHHAKGVTVTPAGQRLVQEARALLRHAEEFTKLASSLGEATRGEITIGCVKALAARFMPELMCDFARRFPDITVRLEEGEQDDILAAVTEGRAELGIAYDFGVQPHLRAEMLAELPVRASVWPGHRLAGKSKISLHDLAPEPFILCDLPHFRDYFLNLFEREGLTPNVVFRCKSAELVRGLVARGHGYSLHTMVPETPITYDGGQLVIKPLAERFPPARVVSLTAEAHGVRPAVGVFDEFLKQSFAGDARPVQAATA